MSVAAYFLQEEIAASLMRLAAGIANLAASNRRYVDGLRAEAGAKRRDFPTHVAACLLGIDYHDILPCERWAAKQGLFIYVYSRPGAVITRFQDAVIVEQSGRCDTGGW